MFNKLSLEINHESSQRELYISLRDILQAEYFSKRVESYFYLTKRISYSIFPAIGMKIKKIS
jgi:hypothetical protein